MTEPLALQADDGGPVWVVDDDRGVRLVLAMALREAGYRVLEFEDAGRASSAMQSADPRRGGTGVEIPALVFTDVRMPGDDGLVLLERLRHDLPGVPVVVMSAYTDVASTAGAFRGGAQEFLSKPFDLDDVVALTRRLLGTAEDDVVARADTGGAEPVEADPHPILPGDMPRLVGSTPPMRELFRAIGRFAQAPLTVLVTGETGTGKELVARALHRESPRAANPFVALNTAAIPSELLESELFGHEAGAFTGATRRRVGRFEQAHGGTLFLDEIGDMPAGLQTRLLRVLSEGEFFRVGGRELVRVDVRLIAATHQDLGARSSEGRFRADLLHRLDVLRLHLPPLRVRRGDIGLLAEGFLATAARRFDATPKRLAASASARLLAHAWPGNVRELENLCWRLAALVPADTIERADVERALGPREGLAGASPHSIPAADPPDWSGSLAHWAQTELAAGAGDIHARAVARLEDTLLEAALSHTGGRRAEAAAALGIGRNTLNRKLAGREPRE